MRIDRKFQIEKTASADATRYVLNAVYVKGNMAVATDGRVLAIVPISDGPKEVALVPPEAIKEARKIRPKQDEPEIIINGEAKLSDGRSYPLVEGTFPNYEQVIPPKNRKGDRLISINPKLLLDIALALGVDKHKGVILSIPENSTDPVRITTEDEPDAVGVLMPMRFGKR